MIPTQQRRLPVRLVSLSLAWALLIIGSNPVIAQDEPARPAPRERDTEEQLERPDFLPPNLPYPGLPRRNVYRGSSTLRPRGLYPYYRYPFGYNIFGDEDYYGDASADAYERGYRDGYRDGRRAEQFERAYEYGRASYLDAVQDGIGAFRSGDYGEAARQFLLATELHRGDPVSHLHAVHALTAQGRYDEAAAMLRRALQLQPKIVFLPADIRREYGREQDFNDHLHRLEQAAQSGEGAADLWMLLGYYQFFSDRRGDALRSFSRAAELANGPDPVIDRFTDAARASVPRERDQRAPSNAPR